MMPYKPFGGGYLQRLGRMHHEEQANPPPAAGPMEQPSSHSKLAIFLNRDVLWGHMPMTKAARIAAAAV